MKKRIFALMLAGVLAASALAGCGSDGDKKDNAATATPTAAAENAATPTEVPKEDVLSDSVYRYDSIRKKVMIA